MGRFARFIEWLQRSSRRDELPVIRDAWCGIFQDTDHPCREEAVCFMRYSDQEGSTRAMFLCEKHHPDKNPWTRRHFDIKACPIISVELLPGD